MSSAVKEIHFHALSRDISAPTHVPTFKNDSFPLKKSPTRDVDTARTKDIELMWSWCDFDNATKKHGRHKGTGCRRLSPRNGAEKAPRCCCACASSAPPSSGTIMHNNDTVHSFVSAEWESRGLQKGAGFVVKSGLPRAARNN